MTINNKVRDCYSTNFIKRTSASSCDSNDHDDALVGQSPTSRKLSSLTSNDNKDDDINFLMALNTTALVRRSLGLSSPAIFWRTMRFDDNNSWTKQLRR